ncbi:MAG: nitroreductase [Oscillospiraceae bacterium]|nr:nitroreductase [Oscillospiraceae bacterium]
MDISELMKERHSVRQYTDKKIETEKRKKLTALAQECNKESGLNIQIIFDEPNCFKSFPSKLSGFKSCKNYIAVIGKKNDDKTDEKAGYYGEKLVLKAQELGLNTCWVALTHGKSAAEIKPGERLVILIALGYGANQGVPHKSKKISDVSDMSNNPPDWYARGIEAALLAPTALNRQKFRFTLQGDTVKANAGKGAYAALDLGIVKYHFEAASGHKVQY